MEEVMEEVMVDLPEWERHYQESRDELLAKRGFLPCLWDTSFIDQQQRQVVFHGGKKIILIMDGVRKYQGGPKEGQPLHGYAVKLIEELYGTDWNNYHEVAAETISDALCEFEKKK
ncbi:MAG: hypothetical protein ABIJ57_09535 [Pseudomonadota bacterium]|uniref:Uncharacterized protein n=1 Tax=viral metagenome TaxID=1070528 RepID=A0A6M3KP11_9ZZZZ